jgi:Domain of unknown function (DUF1905)
MASVSPVKPASAVCFEATLYTVDGSTIARLPNKASKQSPPRGSVAVQATVNGHAFQTVVEPNGEFGHCMRIDAKQRRAAAIRAGGHPGGRARAARQLAGAAGPAGSSDGPRCRAEEDPGAVEGHHAAGAPGMGPMGSTRPAAPIRVGDGRSQPLQDAEREAPAALLQPPRVHPPRPFEGRQAGRSLMSGLAYAVSELSGPVPVASRR